MPQSGDVVVVDFPGATGTKQRPAVVLSSSLYHQHRPDLVVCLLTTQVAKATAPTDYVLQDWTEAGLHKSSAMRSYLATVDQKDSRVIGQLSD